MKEDDIVFLKCIANETSSVLLIIENGELIKNEEKSIEFNLEHYVFLYFEDNQ